MLSLTLTQLVLATSLLPGAGGAVDPRVTDDVVPEDGSAWNGPATVVLAGPLVWDLGAPKTIAAAAIQADHNDRYVLSVSDDGQQWQQVMVAPPVPEGGLRTRRFDGPGGTGRFVQLSGEAGDGRYSVSELQLSDASGYFGQPALLSPFAQLKPTTWWWLTALVVTVLALLGVRRKAEWLAGARVAVVAAVAMAAYQTCAGPDVAASLTAVRLFVSLIALAAVVAIVLPEKPGVGVVADIALGAAAVSATLCFLNFGTPQFFDAGRRAPTFLHHYDMRTYFPIAKYFDELRFDGVYAASAAAVAEDVGYDALANQPMRDLRDHVVRPIGVARDYCEAVKARFSPERWAQFRADAKYFRNAMGDGGFLNSMNDHGGNATPVWLVGAYLVFGHFEASDFALWAGVFADCVLLLLAFASLWWAFGPRTALVAVTMFGAMDFYMFGTNWFGAALRHDWLSMWAIGVALLRKQRPFAAGAMLAWAAAIRAFPGITFIPLFAPLVFDVFDQLRTTKKLNPAALLQQHRPMLTAIAGAAAATVTLTLASILMFGAKSWADWWRKVGLLDADPHINNIAVKTHLVPSSAVWLPIAVGALLLVCITFRRSLPAVSAASGAALVGVVFAPANYYLHCVFILPVIAWYRRDEVVDPRVWLPLLAMCAGCFWASLTPDLGAHFQRETIVMVLGVGTAVGLVARERFMPRGELPQADATASSST